MQEYLPPRGPLPQETFFYEMFGATASKNQLLTNMQSTFCSRNLRADILTPSSQLSQRDKTVTLRNIGRNVVDAVARRYLFSPSSTFDSENFPNKFLLLSPAGWPDEFVKKIDQNVAQHVFVEIGALP
jgi:hypothetical protein